MAAFYDSYDYLSYWQGRDYEDNCERIALEQLFKKINLRDSLIDIGGGFGRLASVYAPLFQKCLVLDPAEKSLRIGRERTKNFPNVSFIKDSLPKVSFEDSFFSVALMIRVSHHLPDLSQSLKEICRLLKKDGYLVLEVANKIHFLARIRAILKLDFSFTQNLEPIERRSQENIQQKTIAFLNHHPKKIISELKNSGFTVKEILSVSNFRNPILKKIIPQKLLVSWEKVLQNPLGRFFFGPSIFILAQKED